MKPSPHSILWHGILKPLGLAFRTFPRYIYRKVTVKEVDDEEEPLTQVCHAQLLVTKSDLKLIDIITQLDIKMFSNLDDDNGDDGLNKMILKSRSSPN